MSPTQIETWITERYGKIRFDFAEGVHVVSVPVMNGVSTGLGSCKENAMYDLYLDLTRPGFRVEAIGFYFLQWEITRHSMRKGCGL